MKLPVYDHEDEIKSLAHGYLLPHKIKVTAARSEIITILLESPKPLSLAQISQKSKDLSTASVYRTLELFTKKGLVQLIYMGEKIHYEFLHGRKHHHHIICTNCGDFEDIDTCAVINSREKVLDRSRKFAQLSHHSLEFFGTCKSCS